MFTNFLYIDYQGVKLVKDIKLHLFIEQHQCTIISKFCVSIKCFKMDVVKPNTPSIIYFRCQNSVL